MPSVQGSSRILDISGINGLTGPTGHIGPTGPTGPTGATGNVGVRGAMGTGIISGTGASGGTGGSYGGDLITFYLTDGSTVGVSGARGATGYQGQADYSILNAIEGAEYGEIFTGIINGITAYFRTLTVSGRDISIGATSDYTVLIKGTTYEYGRLGNTGELLYNFSGASAQGALNTYWSGDQLTARILRHRESKDGNNIVFGGKVNERGPTAENPVTIAGTADVDGTVVPFTYITQHRETDSDIIEKGMVSAFHLGMTGDADVVYEFTGLTYDNSLEGTISIGSCCFCADVSGNDRSDCIDYVNETYCDSIGGIFSTQPCLYRTEGPNCYPQGSCCLVGGCVESSEFKCDTYGGFFVGGKTCTELDILGGCPVACADWTGACCINQICFELTEYQCSFNENSTWFSGSCDEVNCCLENNNGACCTGEKCYNTSPLGCSQIGGTFWGTGSKCAGPDDESLYYPYNCTRRGFGGEIFGLIDDAGNCVDCPEDETCTPPCFGCEGWQQEISDECQDIESGAIINICACDDVQCPCENETSDYGCNVCGSNTESCGTIILADGTCWECCCEGYSYGACCAVGGDCEEVLEHECQGEFQGNGTLCESDTCGVYAETAVCCRVTPPSCRQWPSSDDLNEENCVEILGGEWFWNASCTDAENSNPDCWCCEFQPGVCCSGWEGDVCLRAEWGPGNYVTPSYCDSIGGTWHAGAQYNCDTNGEYNPCGTGIQPLGACCIEGGDVPCYASVNQDFCNSVNGEWLGEGSNCTDCENMQYDEGVCCTRLPNFIFPGMESFGCDVDGVTLMTCPHSCLDMDRFYGMPIFNLGELAGLWGPQLCSDVFLGNWLTIPKTSDPDSIHTSCEELFADPIAEDWDCGCLSAFGNSQGTGIENCPGMDGPGTCCVRYKSGSNCVLPGDNSDCWESTCGNCNECGFVNHYNTVNGTQYGCDVWSEPGWGECYQIKWSACTRCDSTDYDEDGCPLSDQPRLATCCTYKHDLVDFGMCIEGYDPLPGYGAWCCDHLWEGTSCEPEACTAMHPPGYNLLESNDLPCSFNWVDTGEGNCDTLIEQLECSNGYVITSPGDFRDCGYWEGWDGAGGCPVPDDYFDNPEIAVYGACCGISRQSDNYGPEIPHCEYTTERQCYMLGIDGLHPTSWHRGSFRCSQSCDQPDVAGACCTTDGTDWTCEDDVLYSECQFNAGNHYPGQNCNSVNCADIYPTGLCCGGQINGEPRDCDDAPFIVTYSECLALGTVEYPTKWFVGEEDPTKCCGSCCYWKGTWDGPPGQTVCEDADVNFYECDEYFYASETNPGVPCGGDYGDIAWSNESCSSSESWCPEERWGCCIISDEFAEQTPECFCTQIGGLEWYEGVDCNEVEDTGICCYPSGDCYDAPNGASDCGTNNFIPNEDCSSYTCPQPEGACCNGDACTIEPEAYCGGEWLGEGTNCDDDPCSGPPPPETGACCGSDFTCTEITQEACESNGGYWQGVGRSCYEDPCGACCRDNSGTCDDYVTEEICHENGGLSWKQSKLCEEIECPPPPMGSCCQFNGPGDWMCGRPVPSPLRCSDTCDNVDDGDRSCLENTWKGPNEDDHFGNPMKGGYNRAETSVNGLQPCQNEVSRDECCIIEDSDGEPYDMCVDSWDLTGGQVYGLLANGGWGRDNTPIAVWTQDGSCDQDCRHGACCNTYEYDESGSIIGGACRGLPEAVCNWFNSPICDPDNDWCSGDNDQDVIVNNNAGTWKYQGLNTICPVPNTSGWQLENGGPGDPDCCGANLGPCHNISTWISYEFGCGTDNNNIKGLIPSHSAVSRCGMCYEDTTDTVFSHIWDQQYTTDTPRFSSGIAEINYNGPTPTRKHSSSSCSGSWFHPEDLGPVKSRWPDDTGMLGWVMEWNQLTYANSQLWNNVFKYGNGYDHITYGGERFETDGSGYGVFPTRPWYGTEGSCCIEFYDDDSNTEWICDFPIPCKIYKLCQEEPPQLCEPVQSGNWWGDLGRYPETEQQCEQLKDYYDTNSNNLLNAGINVGSYQWTSSVCCCPDGLSQLGYYCDCEFGAGQAVGCDTSDIEGACCNAFTGDCYTSFGSACQGLNTHCPGKTCAEVDCSYEADPCNPPVSQGACCATDGSCSIETEADCIGVYRGDDTTCNPNPCGGVGPPGG